MQPSDPTATRFCLYCEQPLVNVPKSRRYCKPSHRSAAYEARKRERDRIAKTAQIREELDEAATYLEKKIVKLVGALRAASRSASTTPGPTVIATGWEKRVNELAVGTEAIAHRIAELADHHRRHANAHRKPPPGT